MVEKGFNERCLAIVGLVLTFSICGCSSSLPATDIDPNIAEATFRYQFEHNASGQQTAANVYCVGFGAESANGAKVQDPSRDFLGRLADVTPPVKAYSQCSRSDYHGVVDKVTGRPGLVFTVDTIKCADGSHCQVEGGYYEGNESSSGDTYFLEERDGKWVVVKDVRHWIS